MIPLPRARSRVPALLAALAVLGPALALVTLVPEPEAAAPVLTDEERAWLDAHGPVRVVYRPHYPPFTLHDSEGAPAGIDVDFARLMSVRTGVSFEFVPVATLGDALDALRRGDADVMASLQPTPERASFLSFTEPHAWVRIQFWTRDDAPYARVEDFSTATVAVVWQSAQADWLTRELPDAKPHVVPSAADGIVALREGRVDAFLGPAPVTEYVLNREGITDVVPTGPPVGHTTLAWAARADEPVLFGILESALATVNADDRALVFTKWTGTDLGPPPSAPLFSPVARRALTGAGAGLVLLAASVLVLRSRLITRTRDLFQKTRLLEAVVEGTSDMVFVKDPHGRFLYVNAAGAFAYAKRVDEIVGRTDPELLSPLSASLVTANDARALLSSAPDAREEELVLAGRPRVLHVTRARLVDENGTVTGLVGIARDVTDEKAAREAARRHERMHGLATLVMGVAHEVNNPLTFMRLSAEMNARALARALAEARALERADVERLARNEARVLTGIERLTRIGAGLAQVARVDEEPATRALVDVNSVVKDAVAIACGDASIPVREDLEATRCARTTERGLSHVMLVLLRNALEAVDGRHGGTVTVSTRDVPGGVTVEVTDTGAGIPLDEQPRVFTPFFTTKAKGAGIGLAAAYRIVEAHGGRFSFTSVPGEGTRFTVFLPS